MVKGQARFHLGRTAFGSASFSTKNKGKPGKYTCDVTALAKPVGTGGMDTGCVTRTEIQYRRKNPPRTLSFS